MSTSAPARPAVLAPPPTTERLEGAEGLRRIVAFNRPRFVAAGAVLAGALAVALAASGPVAAGAATVAAVFGYGLAASLGVSWWVYDRSDLHAWRWIAPLLPVDRPRWALVHAGFDETGPELRARLGDPAEVVDLSPILGTVSPSLRRARRREPAGSTATAVIMRPARAGTAAAVALAPAGPQARPAVSVARAVALAPAAASVRERSGPRSTGGTTGPPAGNLLPVLPIATATCDAVLLVFAAHEVRDPDQEQALLADVRRVLRPGGHLVLVEHLRDLPNYLAFGPGALHFRSRRRWLRSAAGAGLVLAAETGKTPFVRGFALCPT